MTIENDHAVRAMSDCQALCRGLMMLCVLWPALVLADFRAGLDAYNRGDSVRAYQAWLPLAKEGDAASQFNIGLLYERGEGVLMDPVEAVSWYRLAAEQNLDIAQYRLGMALDSGSGVPRDRKAAASWYMKAAEQGHIDAQLRLGAMYGDGQGVSKDRRQAVEWYRRAAAQNSVDAQFQLGLAFDKGWGVPEDDNEAIRWYRIAAERGNSMAQNNLGVMYGTGQGVGRDYVVAYAWLNVAAMKGNQRPSTAKNQLRKQMTSSQVVEAQRLSHELLARIEAGQSTVAIRDDVPPEADDKVALVKSVQEHLAALGYEPGPTDGVNGARTVSAVKAFQRDMGLIPTGKISQELRALLKIKRGL